MLQQLPAARVVGLLGCIAPDEHLEAVRIARVEHITLANDAAFALLKVGWPPWCVNMVQSYQTFLHVGSGSKFRCGAK